MAQAEEVRCLSRMVMACPPLLPLLLQWPTLGMKPGCSHKGCTDVEWVEGIPANGPVKAQLNRGVDAYAE